MKTLKLACVCANGEFRPSERTRSLAAGADILIAADGGAAHLAAMGLKPHAVLGDMDSLAGNPWANDPGILRVSFPKDKDRSDAELAVEWAMGQGAEHILLLAAWGGRVDHSIANAALLLRYPGRLFLWDDGFTVQALESGQGVDLETREGAVVSIIPFGRNARVKTRGLKYRLDDEPLDYATHGLSNETEGASFSVAVSEGLIILCVERGEL